MNPMAEAALVGGVTGGLCLVAVLFGRWRWGWIVALALALGGLGFLVAFEGSPAPALAGSPWLSALLLGGWLLLGRLLAGCGGLALGPVPGLAALACGALAGDLAAVALLSQRAEDPRQSARLALTASAGGLLTGVGSPATLLVAHPAQLWPLALAAALVAWPRGRLAADGRPGLTLALLAVAAGSWFHAPAALAAGLAVAGIAWVTSEDRDGPKPKGALLHLALLAVLAGLAGYAGGLWGAEWGLAWAMAQEPALGGPLVVLAGWLLAAAGGEPAAALLASAIVDAPLLPRVPGVAPALAAGIGLGGVGPLLLAGAWREGRRIWGLQLLVALVWAGVVFGRW
jgi:hypothetical protein